MTTPAAQLLSISSLPSGNTPAAHLLSVVIGGGIGGLLPVLSGIKVEDSLPKDITVSVDYPVVVKVLLPEE